MPQRDSRLIGGVYRTGQVLAVGGALTIYTAYNRNTNDVVGLYVLALPPNVQPELVRQLLQPLERNRTIRSAHVIRVYDWGVEGNRAYVATDPARGVTLQHVLDHENLDLPRILDLTRQLASGLKKLHEQGIAGLDLRPQLITVDTVALTDRVQIDDIGLRSLLGKLGYLSTQRGDDIGYLDPRYAPPEYINNERSGPWSDIYQLGLLLFTMITGRLPFVGRTPAETGVMQNTSPVPFMNSYKHGTPAILQEIVEHTLAKAPEQRFMSAAALLTALEAVDPSPRSTAGRATEMQKTQPSSVNLTKEMPRVDEDITVRPTQIGDRTTPDLTSDEVTVRATPAEEGVYAYLFYEEDQKEVQRFAITQKSVIVGRLDPKRGLLPDIDLSAFDPSMTVSRQHARIRFEETFFYIEDLKSRNKTRLGELSLTPLKPELLQHGDVIHFGNVRMVFEIPGMGRIPKWFKH